MRKRIRNRWVQFFLVGLIFTIPGCRFSFQEERKIPTFSEVYQIDPQTLLTALVEEDPNAFVLLTATPPVYPNFAIEPVKWTVADYFYIADAFFHSATDQSLRDFRLQRMSFPSSCSKIDYGFQGGNFSFFKSVPADTGNSRLVVDMYINPNENLAILGEVVYTPELSEWEAIDLQNIRINAWEAFQIAEQNGGENYRETVNNECSVLANYDTQGKHEEWWVTYFAEGSSFELNIDSQTGEYKILHQP